MAGYLCLLEAASFLRIFLRQGFVERLLASLFRASD
jgi:hypothetical protein